MKFILTFCDLANSIWLSIWQLTLLVTRLPSHFKTLLSLLFGHLICSTVSFADSSSSSQSPNPGVPQTFLLYSLLIDSAGFKKSPIHWQLQNLCFIWASLFNIPNHILVISTRMSQRHNFTYSKLIDSTVNPYCQQTEQDKI